jgi:hypothetical protein
MRKTGSERGNDGAEYDEMVENGRPSVNIYAINASSSARYYYSAA